MSVYYVHAVNHIVLRIGGSLGTTMDQLFLCKLIDGLLTLEINTQRRDWRKFQVKN
jgi:hypothetical protein